MPPKAAPAGSFPRPWRDLRRGNRRSSRSGLRVCGSGSSRSRRRSSLARGVNASAPGLAYRTGMVHNAFVVPHASAGDFVVPLPRSLSPLIGNKKKSGMGCAEAGSSFHQLKGPAMKKLFLASAVSALFAAPTTVLAQARPGGVPTLDKVLEASGISVSGYIDTGYTHADRNVEPLTGGFSPRVIDKQNNTLGLNKFGLRVAKQPKEGFGGLVNLTVGRDAQFIHSAPEQTVIATSLFDV